MIKIDSGPGRCFEILVADLSHLGFYMYPGVPNTTAETQETNRNYVPFKTQFPVNLEHVVSSRINAGVSVSLQPWLVCLIVFGGEDDKTDFLIVESSFDVGFSKEQCLNA